MGGYERGSRLRPCDATTHSEIEDARRRTERKLECHLRRAQGRAVRVYRPAGRSLACAQSPSHRLENQNKKRTVRSGHIRATTRVWHTAVRACPLRNPQVTARRASAAHGS